MKQSCNNCGEPIGPKWPVKNPDGSTNWRNVFRIDWGAVIVVAVILFIVWGYWHDTTECRNIIEHPKQYCDAYCESIPFEFNKEPTFNLSEVVKAGQPVS